MSSAGARLRRRIEQARAKAAVARAWFQAARAEAKRVRAESPWLEDGGRCAPGFYMPCNGTPAAAGQDIHHAGNAGELVTHRVPLAAMGRGARWVQRAALGEVVEVIGADGVPIAKVVPALLPVTEDIVGA